MLDQITDGIGIRILLGRYLSLLSEAYRVNILAKKEINWEDSAQNLSHPWISILNKEQVHSGPDYEGRAERNREIVFEKMVTKSFLISSLA